MMQWMEVRAPIRGGCAGGARVATAMIVFWLGQASAQIPGQPAAELSKPGSRTCVNDCHREIVGSTFMHGPAQTDCGTCHVAGGDPKDHKFFFVVPKDQLCLRCHALPREGSMHAPVANGMCLDCHDPHGSEHRRLLVADPKRDLCIRCHSQDIARKEFVHGPVAVGACIVCHKPHSSPHPSLLVSDSRELCLTCHAEIQAKGEPGLHMHAALEQGCSRCHDPHASDHRFQLRDTAPNLCLSCHSTWLDQTTNGAMVVHGAITSEGGCTTCHESHSSRLPGLQRGGQPGTCLVCHDKAIKTADGVSLTNMAALLKENSNRHGPIREGACTACHDPHAGEHFRLLSEEYPPEFYAPFQIDTFKLCFKCHITDLVLKPSGQGLTQFRDGDRNLHWLHVNQEKGRTCRACHEVHASKRPAHIREAVPFGSSGWLLELNFEQTSEGGRCSPGCHTPKSYVRGSADRPPSSPSGASR